MLSTENKNLIVKKGVLLSDKLDECIFKLDYYFRDYPREVTSGLRTKDGQLKEIIKKANEEHLAIVFCQYDFDCQESGIYIWQATWSKLLDKGYIINPPNTAKYIGDNPKYVGRTIQVSTHIDPGNAFDVGAPTQLERDNIAGIINFAMAKEPGLIRSFTEEPKNGCFHINIKI